MASVIVDPVKACRTIQSGDMLNLYLATETQCGLPPAKWMQRCHIDITRLGVTEDEWPALSKGSELRNCTDRVGYDETSGISGAGEILQRRSANAVDFVPEICRLESYSRKVLSTYWNEPIGFV